MIICLIAGHKHGDWKLDYNGVPVISNVGAGFWAIRENQDGATYQRTLGTASETAFTIVTINKDTKKIYLTRYGTGNDRVYDYV